MSIKYFMQISVSVIETIFSRVFYRCRNVNEFY